MEIETHPVQTPQGKRERGRAPKTVTMAAYEVYCHLYGSQEAMVIGDCRGGFGSGELIAFLYARSYPKDQWKERVKEAFDGSKNL